MISGATALCLIFLSAIYLLASRRRRRNALFSHGECEPATICKTKDPLFGFDFILNRAPNVLYDTQVFVKYGTTFVVKPVLARQQMFTINPENIRTLLKDAAWGLGPIRFCAMEHAYGQGFLNTDGKTMLEHKKLLKPNLSRINPQNAKVLATMLEAFLDGLPNGTTVDLQPMLFQIFYRNTLNFLVGMDLNPGSHDAPLTVEKFEEVWITTLNRLGLRIVFPWIAAVLPKAKYLDACQKFHSFLDHFIENTLRTQPNGSLHNDEGSLISSAAFRNRDPLVLRSLISQALLASNATTAYLVSNTVFLLSRHPDTWTLLRAEAIAAGSTLSQPDGLLHSQLYKHVLQETLRLYPLFPSIDRIALQDAKLPTGGGLPESSPIFIPKGNIVTLDVYALHCNEAVFGPDVDSFVPSRWERIQPAQGEYLPFGMGQRACLGESKALREATFTVAQMAAKFPVLESRDNRPWNGVFRATCRNGNGCLVALKS